MNYIKFIYLSVFCGIISILSFFNIVYSYYLNLYLNLNTYIYTFLTSLILGVIFYLIKNDKNKKILKKKLILKKCKYKYLNLNKDLNNKNK